MTDKILLILDIDETLLHATKQHLGRDSDFSLFGYHVYRRPFLDEFLTECDRHFHLGVWSSSSDDYAEEIIRRIFPGHIKPLFVWGRSRCTYAVNWEDNNFEYQKVLKKLKKRGFTLERILIVDDTPAKVKRNYGNAIYMSEFTGDPADEELRLLARYLHRLKDVENVRTIEKRFWREEIIGD